MSSETPPATDPPDESDPVLGADEVEVATGPDLWRPPANPLRRLEWRRGDVLAAVILLVVWRVAAGWMTSDDSSISPLLQFAIGGLLPLLLVTVYPVWAYMRAGGRLPPRVLPLSRLALEAGLAIPVVMSLLLGMMVVGSLWGTWTGEEPGMAEPMREIAFASHPLQFALFALGACVWAPVAEELFFRGLLQNGMALRMPTWLSGVLQTALFTIAHAYSGLHLLLIAFVGGVITLHYLWRRTLAASMFVHCAFNSTITLALLVTMLAASQAPVLGVVLERAPGKQGCRIAAVADGLGADEAGLEAGDVVLKVDGRPIDSPAELSERLLHRQAGDVVQLEVRRDKRQWTASITLSPRPAAAEAPTVNTPDVSE